jgi:hypothetical protein
MSIHDPKISGDIAAASPAPVEERVSIASLESLAGLVEDMTNIHMARTSANLEQAVKDRLGNDATIDDAKRLITEFSAI